MNRMMTRDEWLKYLEKESNKALLGADMPDYYTTTWTFRNGHSWSQYFRSPEMRKAHTERCDLLKDYEITKVVYSDSLTDEKTVMRDDTNPLRPDGV